MGDRPISKTLMLKDFKIAFHRLGEVEKFSKTRARQPTLEKLRGLSAQDLKRVADSCEGLFFDVSMLLIVLLRLPSYPSNSSPICTFFKFLIIKISYYLVICEICWTRKKI